MANFFERGADKRAAKIIQRAGAEQGEEVLIVDSGKALPERSRVEVIATTHALYLRLGRDLVRLPYREWVSIGSLPGVLSWGTQVREYLVEFSPRPGRDLPAAVLAQAPRHMRAPEA